MLKISLLKQEVLILSFVFLDNGSKLCAFLLDAKALKTF